MLDWVLAYSCWNIGSKIVCISCIFWEWLSRKHWPFQILVPRLSWAILACLFAQFSLILLHKFTDCCFLKQVSLLFSCEASASVDLKSLVSRVRKFYGASDSSCSELWDPDSVMGSPLMQMRFSVGPPWSKNHSSGMSAFDWARIIDWSERLTNG